jgi:hypothetical protein
MPRHFTPSDQPNRRLAFFNLPFRSGRFSYFLYRHFQAKCFELSDQPPLLSLFVLLVKTISTQIAKIISLSHQVAAWEPAERRVCYACSPEVATVGDD